MTELSDKIKSYISLNFGESNLNQFIEYLKSEPSQYLRVNNLRISTISLAEILLKKYEIETELVSGIPNALKIKKDNGLAGKTIEHILGYYYIQGLSSMLPPLVLNPSSKDIVLDLCAAPGSKTTQLAELMENKGTLIANEIQLNRVKALVHNIERMNVINAGVLHKKGELLSKIYTNYFDKILVDAPCSGLGIIQKKDEVLSWWNEEKVKGLAELQFKLLVSAVKMCKAGGEIVYSTCTLTNEENEQVINKIISKYPVKIVNINIPVDSHDGVGLNNVSIGKRLFPWEVNSDGFFITKIRKTEETETSNHNSVVERQIRFFSFSHKEVNKKLKSLSDYFGIENNIIFAYKYFIKGSDIHFINEEWNDKTPNQFNKIGLKLGSIDKSGEIVLHSHAGQIFGNYLKEKIITLQDKNDLKIYMEGGIIKNDSFKKGQHIVKYGDYLLGTAVVTEVGIKSRFPRSKRTQEIYTDF